jgi:protease I
MKFLFKALLALTMSSAVFAEDWMEKRWDMPSYDLDGRKIMMVVGHDYDHHEVFDIKSKWERWGAEVYVVAPTAETVGHTLSFAGQSFDSEMDSRIETDILLADAKMDGFHALYFPGGNGPEQLVQEFSPMVRGLIDDAIGMNIPIAAICGGPLALTAHDHFKGVRLTASQSKAQRLTEYGADLVNEKVVVTDNLITANWPFFDSFAMAVAHKVVEPTAAYSDIFPSDSPVIETMRSMAPTHLFEDAKVSQEDIRKIVSAGTSVPMIDFNNQHWQFVVVESAEKRAKIKKEKLSLIEERGLFPHVEKRHIESYWGRLMDNPVLVIGFRKNKDSSEAEESQLVYATHQTSAVVAAGMNMLLAATTMGLGTHWLPDLSLVDDEIKKVLGLDSGLEYVFAFALGHPAFQGLPSVRKPVDEVLTVM